MSDNLARAQAIVQAHDAPVAFARTIIRLEDELATARRELRDLKDERPCQFPEHRDTYGNVTHMRLLGTFGDRESGSYGLVCCEVCGVVQAHRPVAIG